MEGGSDASVGSENGFTWVKKSKNKRELRETRTEQDCVFIFVLVFYPNLELVLKCNHA